MSKRSKRTKSERNQNINNIGTIQWNDVSFDGLTVKDLEILLQNRQNNINSGKKRSKLIDILSNKCEFIISNENLNKLTVKQIKIELKLRNLKVYGSKNKLIKAINDCDNKINNINGNNDINNTDEPPKKKRKLNNNSNNISKDILFENFGEFNSGLFGYTNSDDNTSNDSDLCDENYDYDDDIINDDIKNENNNDNNNEKPKLFKNITDIMKNDKKDIENDAKIVKDLYKMYKHVCLTNENEYNTENINDILKNMMKYIPKSHKNNYNYTDLELKEQKEREFKECQVCFTEFDNDTCKCIKMDTYCYHQMICSACFNENIRIRIDDKNVTPWLLCCAPNCSAPINIEILLKYLNIKQKYQFSKIFINNHLHRNSNYFKCNNSKCIFGFIILNDKFKDGTSMKCLLCNNKSKIYRNPLKSDQGFQEMINCGILRLCPSCELPTMKDKGMCNIIHCGQCKIFWNWRTKETATNSKQLKQNARWNGTLWEPGELEYQWSLQDNNPQEFKRLLESNGIKYDPNYVRGT